MTTIIFLISFAVTVFASVFGWTKIIVNLKTPNKLSKDYMPIVVWFVIFAAVGTGTWFLNASVFWGYLTGLAVGLGMSLNTTEKSSDSVKEEKASEDTTAIDTKRQ
jgi:hypothetical protein